MENQNADVDGLEAKANTPRNRQRQQLAAATGIPDKHTCSACGKALTPTDVDDFVCNECAGHRINCI